MAKNNSALSVAAVPAFLLTMFVLNKSYKPLIDKLSKQFLEQKKKEQTNTKAAKKKKELNLRKMEILNCAQKIVEPVESLVKEAQSSWNIEKIKEYNLMSKSLEDYLIEKVQSLVKYEIIPYEPQLPILIKQTIEDFEPQMTPLLIAGPTITLTENDIEKTKTTAKKGFLSIVYAALVTSIVLNIGNIKDVYEEIVDTLEIERIWGDLTQTNSNTFLEQEEIVDEITYEEEFARILALEGVSMETKLDKIISSFKGTYLNKFDTILTYPHISLDEKLNTILHSDITNYHNIFNYIMEKDNIPMELKINAILNSNLTSYKEIFHFILGRSEITLYEKMEILAFSKIATYEEKINFIQEVKEINLEGKVWFTLLIPNVSFETKCNDLLKLEGTTEDQIIKCIIKADMVPFKSLFDTILKATNLENEQIVGYLNLYNESATYNRATFEEKVNYVFGIQNLMLTEKLDCMWEFLQEYTLDEKIQIIENFYGITTKEEDYQGEFYARLLTKKEIDVTSTEYAIMYLYEKVLKEMEEYVLEHYDVENVKQLEVGYAICAAEGAYKYKDLYWVANTPFNRITNIAYVKEHGTSPYAQFIASRQFSVYGNGMHKRYLNATKPEYTIKYEMARIAFLNMFYYGYDGVKHNYLEFRSSYVTDFSDNYIVPGGNRYGVKMKEANRIIYENLLDTEESKEYTQERSLTASNTF